MKAPMDAPTGLKMKVRVGNPVGNNFVSFQDTSYDTLLVCDNLQGILLIDQSQFQFLLWNFTQFPNAAAQPPPLDLTGAQLYQLPHEEAPAPLDRKNGEIFYSSNMSNPLSQ